MLRATIRTAALAALSTAFLATPAAAQIRLIPQVGLYQPFSKLPSAGAGFDELKKKASFAFGAAIEFGQPDKVSFRVNVLHATDSEVPVEGTGLGCTSDCARSTVSSATATLILRGPNIILVQPYLIGGGGVKRYDYTLENLQNEGVRTLLNDQNQLTGHLGLGAEVNLGVLRLVGEVSDLLSSYDDGQNTSESDRLQHDMFVTVGLVIGD
jgi:hypothetical protein